MENKTGKFIVIDGTDGSGKTTQLSLLKEKLESEGYSVAVADFPQYNTKSAGLVEEYLSGKYGEADEVDPYKSSIFYAVDRFDASAKINNWLKEGKIVLANRYTSANLAHQGGKINNPLERKIFFNWLFDLEYKIFEIPKPDLTIILQVEPEISFKLARDRQREDWKGKTKDIHENNLDHLRKAEQTYLEITSSLPGFKLVKCTHKGEILSPEAIHFLVWLITNQIVKTVNKAEKNFQAISNIIGSNKQILNNRDLILKKKDAPGPTPATEEENSDATKDLPISTTSYEKAKMNDNIKSLDTELIVEKLIDNAKLPRKALASDAGYDLFSNDYYSLPAYGQALVSTGIKIKLPKSHVGLVWDKSGLATEGITTMGGVIDENYRGEIKVVIKNLSEDMFNIVPGQKIAQLLIQKIEHLEIKEEKINDTTERQGNGFGSTGKF
ncbi:MAG: dUTP diphosphatase [Patescibacteria group bacterium]|nr:dUTP diphosphatase [Patescibacteria group bacterium]NCU39826.1 dUTP diphosphatase [Candidatus Falkowbacteria bacterium]